MRAAAANILILRRVKPDQLLQFEEAVRLWIPMALQHPGYLGVFLIRPGPGSEEYGAILRFQSRSDWERFRDWPAYQKFVADIRPMLIDDPRVEEMHGLEAWFNNGRHSPPRWKMACLTWVGVCIAVFVTSRGIGLINSEWPWWVTFLLVNGIVVAGLTWIVMPILTRLAAGWLVRAGS